jgi:uncharacterized protein YdaU (DUF1376 family)
LTDNAKTPMHHYPWHPGDYQLATNHWSELRTVLQCEAGLLHDLAYRRLIDMYYGIGGPIPDKTHWVATRVRMVAHVDVVGSVLKEKFTREGGFWHNDKCDKELARYRKRVVANQENGKKGGRKPTGNPPANPLGSKPRTINHKPRNTPLPPEGEVWWSEFWSAYPRKVGKPLALRAFAKALGRATSFEAIMAGLKRHLGCDQWSDQTKIPHPSTWLNRDGWEDEVAVPPGGPGGDDPKAWWASRQGLLDKAVELQVPAPADDHPETFRRFKASVWVAAGDGPWWDDKDTAYVLAVKLRDGGV